VTRGRTTPSAGGPARIGQWPVRGTSRESYPSDLEGSIPFGDGRGRPTVVATARKELHMSTPDPDPVEDSLEDPRIQGGPDDSYIANADDDDSSNDDLSPSGSRRSDEESARGAT